MRAVLRRFYGPDCDTDAIMDALHAQAETAFQAPPPKKPGLDELIAYLEAQHIPMVVASSSRMASILRHLNNWHMTDHFQALISGEQFSSKPDPEIFLTAAKALGTTPAETLVLEDSYNGVRAGAAGGFVTVMVPDLAQPDDEMRRLYTAECKDLREVKKDAGGRGSFFPKPEIYRWSFYIFTLKKRRTSSRKSLPALSSNPPVWSWARSLKAASMPSPKAPTRRLYPPQANRPPP